jgi:hypothetical protein
LSSGFCNLPVLEIALFPRARESFYIAFARRRFNFGGGSAADAAAPGMILGFAVRRKEIFPQATLGKIVIKLTKRGCP